MFSLRSQTEFYTRLLALPDLFSGTGQRGEDSRRQKIVMVGDPIGDMIIRIKNAVRAGKTAVAFPFSNSRWRVAEILKEAGYLRSLVKKGKRVKKLIEVEVAFVDGRPKLNEVRRVSKPSRRIYRRWHEIKSVRKGAGLAVYSTSRGVLSGSEARRQRVGGEFFFQVW